VFDDPKSYKATKVWDGLTHIDPGGAYDNPGFLAEQEKLRREGKLNTPQPTKKPSNSSLPIISIKPDPSQSPTESQQPTPTDTSVPITSSDSPAPSESTGVPSISSTPTPTPTPTLSLPVIPAH
jgi:hypothetical protein